MGRGGGRCVSSFCEGQEPELEQWSWRRRDGTERCSGDRTVKAWGLKVGSKERMVSGPHPEPRGWVTSCQKSADRQQSG